MQLVCVKHNCFTQNITTHNKTHNLLDSDLQQLGEAAANVDIPMPSPQQKMKRNCHPWGKVELMATSTDLDQHQGTQPGISWRQFQAPKVSVGVDSRFPKTPSGRLKLVRNISCFAAAPGSTYLGLHCFGVLDEVPVLSIHTVGHLKLLHKGTGLSGGHTVPSTSPLNNDTFDVLRDAKVHLQPLLPRLGLGHAGKPARAAAHQAGHAGRPVIASDGRGRDL